MNVFDFFTQDELDDAPEDGAQAFAYLVRIAQTRLADRCRALDDEDRIQYSMIEEARYGFMNTVVGLGKSLGVEPFRSMEVPRYDDFNESTHRQLRADIDHYLTQLVVGNARQARRDSIKVAPAVKETIRTHLHHIKVHLDKATMPEAKRATLHAKLAAFETALEKDRLNVLAVGRVVLEILSVSCNVLALADSATLQRLLTTVMVDVAEAKAADDEQRRLPPVEPIQAILPPRREEPKRGKRLDFSADLDDEIPF
jgi:hypothetical protein